MSFFEQKKIVLINFVSVFYPNLKSFVIFDAIFLKAILLPLTRLNRTPFNDNRGSLHTSISHWTMSVWILVPVRSPPYTQNIKNGSRSSKLQLFFSKLLKISCTTNLASILVVVFILHVNLNARGLAILFFKCSTTFLCPLFTNVFINASSNPALP